MIVYIAGPMTGIEHWNHPAFHAAAAEVRGRGFVAVNPAEGIGGDTTQDRGVYMRIALHNLLACDAIYMLSGWRSSAGARLEMDIARELDLTVLDGSADQ